MIMRDAPYTAHLSLSAWSNLGWASGLILACFIGTIITSCVIKYLDRQCGRDMPFLFYAFGPMLFIVLVIVPLYLFSLHDTHWVNTPTAIPFVEWVRVAP